MHYIISTNNLEKFNDDQKYEIIKLMDFWLNIGLPKDFIQTGVNFVFDLNNNKVFLSNTELQKCMFSDESNKMITVHTCPVCGLTGTKEELINDGEKCCHEYLEKTIGLRFKDIKDMLV